MKRQSKPPLGKLLVDVYKVLIERCPMIVRIAVGLVWYVRGMGIRNGCLERSILGEY
jgi:hypothetical protein